MTEETTHRRSGGRAARQAARAHAHAQSIPFLTRTLAPFEVLGEEGLAQIEWNADTILQEVGLEFRVREGTPSVRAREHVHREEGTADGAGLRLVHYDVADQDPCCRRDGGEDLPEEVAVLLP